jgi:P27 family predicted phage terminase small subunit
MPQPEKSEAEHFLTGTKPQGNRYKGPAESYLPPSRPRYPKGLDKDGRRIFKLLCKLLEERRALTAGDFEAIRLYAVLHKRHATATAHLEAEGEICEITKQDKDGEPFTILGQNLWLKIATGAERQMLAILVQLGLTPKAKDAVRPTKSGKEMEQEDFMESYMTGRSMKTAAVVPIPVRVDPAEMTLGDDDDDAKQTEQSSEEKV